MKTYTTNSSQQTKELGRKLAQKFLSKGPQQKALVLGLIGDLGGGKTTLVQGFAEGLGIKQKILSPTFIILRKFEIRKEGPGRSNEVKFENFYHIDCYRIEQAQEILDLDFKQIISDPKNIVVVEWADRIEEILPKTTLTLKFEIVNHNTREITIINFPY